MPAWLLGSRTMRDLPVRRKVSWSVAVWQKLLPDPLPSMAPSFTDQRFGAAGVPARQGRAVEDQLDPGSTSGGELSGLPGPSPPVLTGPSGGRWPCRRPRLGGRIAAALPPAPPVPAPAAPPLPAEPAEPPAPPCCPRWSRRCRRSRRSRRIPRCPRSSCCRPRPPAIRPSPPGQGWWSRRCRPWVCRRRRLGAAAPQQQAPSKQANGRGAHWLKCLKPAGATHK